MHSAAEKRMRMTNQPGKRGRRGTARRPQDGFEASDWAGEEEISRIVVLGHLFLRAIVATKLDRINEALSL
jgi:hypothetical protein